MNTYRKCVNRGAAVESLAWLEIEKGHPVGCPKFFILPVLEWDEYTHLP